MGLDTDYNVVFSSDLSAIFSQPVSVYSVTHQSFEQKKKDFEYGMFVGYRNGLDEALKGRPSNPEYLNSDNEVIKQGYKTGYPEGYAVGVFEKNFQQLHKTYESPTKVSK